jgi:hypothetical protein
MGRLMAALRVAAPSAADALREASESIAFTELDSQFRVEHGVVTVQRANLEGPRMQVVVSGQVGVARRIAGTALLTLRGAAGRAVAAFLEGGTIPLAVSGTLAAPRVLPQVDPARLVSDPLDRVPDLVEEIKKKLPKLPGLGGDLFK